MVWRERVSYMPWWRILSYMGQRVLSHFSCLSESHHHNNYYQTNSARGLPIPPSRDLLDVYLEAMEQEHAGEGANGEGDEHIFRNINDIFLAGSDTTATTISATLYEVGAWGERERR